MSKELDGIRSAQRSRRQNRATECAAIMAMLSAFTSAAKAHPGHGLFEHGPVHVATSPFHLLVLVGLGIALAVAANFVQRTGWRVAFGVGATACLLAATLLVLR